MARQPAQPVPALAIVPPKRLVAAMQQARQLTDAVGRAARRYLQLPDYALQLRLALFTDEFKRRVPRELEGPYDQEFSELVQAIYG